MKRMTKWIAWLVISGVALVLGIAAWPGNKPCIFVRRFDNLSVATGHAELAALEYGFRDDIAMRLYLRRNTTVQTLDDDGHAETFDYVISGAFAAIGHRRLMAVATITDGAGILLSSGSWTADALQADLLRDRASLWARQTVGDLIGRHGAPRPRHTAARAFAAAVRALDDEGRDPSEIIDVSVAGAQQGADPSALAMMQAEAERRRGHSIAAAQALLGAEDVPKDCLLGLLAWSVAYQGVNIHDDDRALASAAHRAVRTFPDIPMVWRALGLLDRSTARQAFENAVLLEVPLEVTWPLDGHLASLSSLAGDRREALAAAAAGALLGYDDTPSIQRLVALRAEGQRPGMRFDGTSSRLIQDRRLWAWTRETRDVAVLASIAALARRRQQPMGRRAFVPEDATPIIGRAIQALRRRVASGDPEYPHVAALATLTGSPPDAAYKGLPPWRRADHEGDLSWRPIGQGFEAARNARYPEPAIAGGGNPVPSAPDYEAAAAAYIGVIDRDPESRYAARSLNNMVAALGDDAPAHDKVLAWWLALTSRHPESPNCARGRAQALLARWQSSLNDRHLGEARDAFRGYLDAAGWRPAAILDAVHELANLGGSGGAGAHAVEPVNPAVRPLLEDAAAYLDRLGPGHTAASEALRGCIRAQLGQFPAATRDLDAAVSRTEWKRTQRIPPGFSDPMSLNPSQYAWGFGPSRMLLIARLADAYLRAGSPEESAGRLLLMGRTSRLEASERLYARAPFALQFVTSDRTLAAFTPPWLGEGPQLLWWFGCGSKIEQFIVQDLDGDGTCEVIVGTHADGADHAAIYLLDNRGRMTARFEAGSDAAFPLGRRHGIKAIATLDVDGDGKLEIVAAANHDNEGGGRIVVLDRRLRLIGDYWHPGHIVAICRWPQPPGRHGPSDLAFVGINNARGAPRQNVFMLGRLRCRDIRAQAEPCRAPGYPPVSLSSQPVYEEAADLGFGTGPNVLNPRDDGLLHVFCRTGDPRRAPYGVLVDGAGRVVRRYDRDPGDPPPARLQTKLPVKLVALVVGVSQYAHQSQTSQLLPGLDALQRHLGAAGNTSVLTLRDEGVRRETVLRSVRETLPTMCDAGPTVWVHFSGHAFAQVTAGVPDIYLEMFDAAPKGDTRRAVSLRTLWSELGAALPDCPVLLTLDCCLARPDGTYDRSAQEALEAVTSRYNARRSPIDGLIITACQPGRTASAGEFLDALNDRIKARDTANALNAQTLYGNIRRAMGQRSGHSQMPSVFGEGDPWICDPARTRGQLAKRD